MSALVLLGRDDWDKQRKKHLVEGQLEAVKRCCHKIPAIVSQFPEIEHSKLLNLQNATERVNDTFITEAASSLSIKVLLFQMSVIHSYFLPSVLITTFEKRAVDKT